MPCSKRNCALIVPYGIEIQKSFGMTELKIMALIVPYGIEIFLTIGLK